MVLPLAARRSLFVSSRSYRPLLALQITRSYPSYQPPTPLAAKETNPHREYYKQFGRPVSLVFLGALFTYQVIYWMWLKFESMEEKQIKEEEMGSLEKQLRTLQKLESTLPART